MAKILIIRLTSLGDVIFTLPLVNTLAENNEVSYLVSEKGLGVIKDNPSIKNVHFAPLKKWRKSPFSISRYIEFFKLIKEIRQEEYDIAIDCQQMFKSLMLMLLCGAKRRITNSDARELSILAGNEFVKPKAKFRDFNYHIVERILDMARHLGIEPKEIKFPLPDTTAEVKEKVSSLLNSIDTSKKTVVIAPETTWKNKHININVWQSILQELNNKCNIIFTGINDKLYKEILADKEISHINLVGKTNLEELREIFSRADIVISPDSGSANLAWASGKPAVIELFTCTPKNRFGVYGNSEKYFAIQQETTCSPCFKKKCRNKTLQCCNIDVNKILPLLHKFI